MKKLLLAAVIFGATFTATVKAQTPIELTGEITTNLTLKGYNVYKLKGFVYVKNGATITIEPGTVIRGDKASKGTLIITRGSKIMAQGTPELPIVFTSDQPIGQRAPGDWGGIILLGKSTTNNAGGEQVIEGGVDNANGDGKFGGTDVNDNSGVMKYVRVEFPGVAFQPNNEINGVTFGGVGAGTTFENVQVSYSGDDSFEWFGGTVNVKHLIAFRGIDDEFDTDNGFSGKAQFLVSVRDSNLADAAGASNGFESDNDANASLATPFTKAIFSNVSFFGPRPNAKAIGNSKFNAGALIRRSSKECAFNTIFAGYPKGIIIDGANTQAYADNGELEFAGNIIAGCNSPLNAASPTTWDVTTWFNAPAKGNTILTSNDQLMINDPFNYTKPNFLPKTGSPALTGSVFTSAKLNDAFFTKVDYRGAFGATDWTTGWSNFDPQNTDYTKSKGVNAISEVSGNINTATVYPNPTANEASLAINVRNNAVANIAIVDITGKVIATQTETLVAGANTININTANLTAGVYFVRTSTDNGVVTVRLNVVK